MEIELKEAEVQKLNLSPTDVLVVTLNFPDHIVEDRKAEIIYLTERKLDKILPPWAKYIVNHDNFAEFTIISNPRD